ncbi:MAG: hypothetical protein IPP34_09975 [Bacteroidetes bacterium]|nr:hypothetical protein [Bacteroidota bacterium]
MKADLKINIITHSKGQVFNEAKSNFHIVFVYHVDNLEELLTINPETNHMTVDGGLSNAIASISFQHQGHSNDKITRNLTQKIYYACYKSQ